MAHKQLNQLKYAALLVETLPRPIESEAANERALKVVARLLAKPKLSPEEDNLLELVSCLIRAFEDRHYAIAESAACARVAVVARKSWFAVSGFVAVLRFAPADASGAGWQRHAEP